ncbi:hypothetical protein J2R73_011630 [Bradyrhizobium japonicum]|nr:hypothetical protein [Bradyrhizobium japonicum]MCS4126120.1 hypothetical protein [Bradyrhizobium japonicum]
MRVHAIRLLPPPDSLRRISCVLTFEDEEPGALIACAWT